MRTLDNLVDIYFSSVGSNSVLLLNIPPDRRGLIHEVDAERIAAFGDYIRATFAKSMLRDKVRPWQAKEGDCREYRVKPGKSATTILLAEDIRHGQRVEHFTVEALIDGKWQHLTEGSTIGYKRLLRFEECSAERIRVTIDRCRNTAHILNIGLY